MKFDKNSLIEISTPLLTCIVLAPCCATLCVKKKIFSHARTRTIVAHVRLFAVREHLYEFYHSFCCRLSFSKCATIVRQFCEHVRQFFKLCVHVFAKKNVCVNISITGHWGVSLRTGDTLGQPIHIVILQCLSADLLQAGSRKFIFAGKFWVWGFDYVLILLTFLVFKPYKKKQVIAPLFDFLPIQCIEKSFKQILDNRSTFVVRLFLLILFDHFSKFHDELWF